MVNVSARSRGEGEGDGRLVLPVRRVQSVWESQGRKLKQTNVNILTGSWAAGLNGTRTSECC